MGDTTTDKLIVATRFSRLACAAKLVRAATRVLIMQTMERHSGIPMKCVSRIAAKAEEFEWKEIQCARRPS
jgi:hypothetical protein